MDTNEPGAAVLALYSKLIDTIKQTQPMRSDDKPLKGGRVYSMLTLGMPVNPDDYQRPWNPQGAAPPSPVIPPPPAAGLNSVVPAAAATPADGSTPPPDTPATLEASRAMQAAFNTSQLCTMLLSVTDDQTYEEYPDGRGMDYAYPAILKGIHPIGANEVPDPAVVAAVAKANAVLYLPNADGTPSVNETPMYQNYIANSNAYGSAIAAYAAAYAVARENPSQMVVWPTTSRPLQMAVTQARQALISQGAPQIEAAIDAIATAGYPYQAALVASAQDSYQDWQVSLAGQVNALSPYCQIMPSDWASDDPGACRSWETLTVNQSDYSSLNVSSALTTSQFSWFNKTSQAGGSAAASFLGFVKLGGGGSSSSSSQGSQNSSTQNTSNTNFTDAKNLTITITYGLCTIKRPWFCGDLFYMQNWYMNGGQKNSISTGNIEDQLGSKLPDQLMPMVPQQMLVIRNVKISAGSWGSFEQELTNAYGSSSQGSSTKSNSQAASAGFSLGFISFGGSGSHSATTSQGSGGSVSLSGATNAVSFDSRTSTLTIPGPQILGFLCDITPASPPKDDPEWGTTAATATGSTGTPTATGSTAATPAPAPVGAAQ